MFFRSTANKMQRFSIYLFLQNSLHVSGGSSAHHQEHKIVHAASGIVNQYCCLMLSWMRWNASSISSTIAPSSSIGWQYLTLHVQFCAPDDGRRNRLKHVENFVERNKSRNVASCWLYFGNKSLDWCYFDKQLKVGTVKFSEPSVPYWL